MLWLLVLQRLVARVHLRVEISPEIGIIRSHVIVNVCAEICAPHFLELRRDSITVESDIPEGGDHESVDGAHRPSLFVER